MPVTIKPSRNIAKANKGLQGETRAEGLLQGSCPREYRRCNEIIRSSFDDLPRRDVTITPASNGLFEACHEAYSDHYHLRIRPEDVWFTILSQLSFYINAHAEELRSFFVAHEGQKELEVFGADTIYSTDFGLLTVQMTREIEKNVLDASLREWIMPDFSTTTGDDIVTAAILMMGSLQKFFTYKMTTFCGLPSVTLLGGKHDWERISLRLDKIHHLGKEPGEFGSLLKPIINNFVNSFDRPNDDVTKDFWGRIIHYNRGMSGMPSFYTGWMSAFAFWSCNGKKLLTRTYRPDTSYKNFNPHLNITDALQNQVSINDIPSGTTSVPVTVDDRGTIYNTRMVAGIVGKQWSCSGGAVEASQSEPGTFPFARQLGASAAFMSPAGRRPALDTVQPLAGWWMYELLDAAEAEEAAGGDATENPVPVSNRSNAWAVQPQLPKNERGINQVPFWHRPRAEIVKVQA